MIAIYDKKCGHENCKHRPFFNYENEKQGIYCSVHKLDGMVNIKSKTCENIDCKKIPHYNYEGISSGLFCTSHKLMGMVNVRSKTCENIDCIKIPHYNYEKNTSARFCATHKLDGMINIISKSCINDWCDTIPSNKIYGGYCFFCYVNTFPDQPVCRNYKTKETAVAQFITTNFPNFTWILDKKVEDGCSRRRPDLICDLGYQVIIVEVDENMHENYDCSCENKRIMQLSQDIGHRPLIFIRFNPDDYINLNNEKITSCWGTTPKTGILKIKNNKINEWNNRLEELKSQIEYWTNDKNKTDKTIEIIQLFYNQNN